LQEGWLKGYPTYRVETYAHSYGGSMNLVQATLKSDNTVYAQLDADVTPDAVRQTAYDMGITSKLDALPAEGLGGLTHGVSPLEMASAYATIASGGYRSKPIAITRVDHPSGEVDNLGKPRRVKAFDSAVTAKATDILTKNVQSGTGTAASYGCPAAGKTGTTSDYKDAWFVGFEPHLSSAVWVGYPNPPIPMTSVHGIEVAGGTFPAQIWHDYMNLAHGSFCQGFSLNGGSFQSSPFFGRYASTGSHRTSGSSGTGYGGYRPRSIIPTPQYNPKYYATPPQPAPKVTPPPPPKPPAPPSNGGGSPNSNGGGAKGNGK
jgi:penicillin-binding protein 1A